MLWLDCDREGENICFEVIEVTLGHMRGPKESLMGRVYRAKFSAIAESDILKAYGSLGRPNKDESDSVDARQELDLKVGVAFSRFQTRFFQGRYGDLDSEILSYGPCPDADTRLLRQAAHRHRDVCAEALLDARTEPGEEGRQAPHLGGRAADGARQSRQAPRCLPAGRQPCTRGRRGQGQEAGAPPPLNTVALLKACSKSLGIGPGAAMHLAESLYLTGCISYPRTESTAYPLVRHNRRATHAAIRLQMGKPRPGAPA